MLYDCSGEDTACRVRLNKAYPADTMRRQLAILLYIRYRRRLYRYRRNRRGGAVRTVQVGQLRHVPREDIRVRQSRPALHGSGKREQPGHAGEPIKKNRKSIKEIRVYLINNSEEFFRI